MAMFIASWPGWSEVLVFEADSPGVARSLMRDGRVSPKRQGTANVQPIPDGTMLKMDGRHTQLVLPVEATSRSVGPGVAWFDFQERVGALLERFPSLSDLVPPTVRYRWRTGVISILDVLVEVADRALPARLSADERALEVEHINELRGGG